MAPEEVSHLILKVDRASQALDRLDVDAVVVVPIEAARLDMKASVFDDESGRILRLCDSGALDYELRLVTLLMYLFYDDTAIVILV